MDLLVLAMAAIIHMDGVEVSWNDNIYLYHKYQYTPHCSCEDLATSSFELPNPKFYGFHDALQLVIHDNVTVLTVKRSPPKCMVSCFGKIIHHTS